MVWLGQCESDIRDNLPHASDPGLWGRLPNLRPIANRPVLRRTGARRALVAALRKRSPLTDKERVLVHARIHRDIEESDHHLLPALMPVANLRARVRIAGIVRGVIENSDPLK